MHISSFNSDATTGSTRQDPPGTQPVDPGEEWARRFAECLIRHTANAEQPTEIDYSLIQPVPDDERRLTPINEIMRLPAREGAYANLDQIKWVFGKWQTAGPCEPARRHYQAWQAAPGAPHSAEYFHDALFEELRGAGRFVELVEQAMADWKQSGQLARRVRLYRIMHPDIDAKEAEKEIKYGLLAWNPPAGIQLDQRFGWNLVGEADHRANRLAETRPVLKDWALKFVAMEWQLWHDNHASASSAQGRRFDADRESRLLNKMLILKQVLDVDLARQTAVDRVQESRRARDDFCA